MEIGNYNEANDILKSIDCNTSFELADNDFDKALLDELATIVSEIEKAHNVGDLFFANGKQYVWTEYSPGKFDWHVVKNKKIVRGKGINGVHGFKMLEKAFTSIDKTFTDKDKMLLRRTPNGHWRLIYNEQDTGDTIAGDTITEQEIQRSFDELAKGRTGVIIAHRLATVRNADRIVLVDDGRIVEEGSHDELMKLDGGYAKLYNTQKLAG